MVKLYHERQVLSIALPLYLAMTAAELHQQPQLPQHTAWMACHFSPYGTGLSNLPSDLPSDSMLILNDRTPIAGHDAQRILEQLSVLVEQLQIRYLLLDFQRPNEPQTTHLVDVLTNKFPCPVGVSDLYAKDVHTPVFLPPPPLHIPLETYLSPWRDREIWLDTSLEQGCITITEDGAAIQSKTASSQNPIHFDQTLLCHYQIETETHCVRFLLHRTQEDLEALLTQAFSLGVAQAVGLYQELGKHN